MSTPTQNPRPLRLLLIIAALLLAIVLACSGLLFTAHVFDRNGWPVFHSWGLAHGSGLLLFSVYFALAFGLVWLVALAARYATRKTRGPD